MISEIKKAAVIGSGVMGSGIAAHLANAGIKTYLLDIVPSELTEEEAAKGLTLKTGLCGIVWPITPSKIAQAKPAPLTSKDNLHLIETAIWKMICRFLGKWTGLLKWLLKIDVKRSVLKSG